MPIHYFVRDNGVIQKLAGYVILGINKSGKKEVFTIQVGDNESSKYWLPVLDELKNRGVKDILILCDDGLTGMKEAIVAAFPKNTPHYPIYSSIIAVVYAEVIACPSIPSSPNAVLPQVCGNTHIENSG